MLRPRFTLLKGSGELSLLHEGKPLATLTYDQYIDFNVDPGRHVLTLEPGLLDSSVLRRQLTLDARAGSTYFLAYWTNLAPVGGLSFFPVGGALPLIVLPNNESRIVQVRFEEVSQGEALEALSTLFRTPRFICTDE